MKTIAIIQARMQSTRLPGKVLMDIAGKPMLLRIFERVSQSKYLDDIIVATSDSVADDVVEQFCMEHHIDCFRGSQNNVLERFYLCSKCYCGELIIRLTADNIFVDAQIIDAGIQYFRGQLNLDYLYYREGLPLGTAVELFTADALARTYQEAGDSECLEHVTLYMYRNPELFECQRAERQEKDYSHIRLTMDTEQDCQLVKELYKRLLKNDVVLLKDAIKEIECDEKLKRINENIEQVIPQYGK